MNLDPIPELNLNYVSLINSHIPKEKTKLIKILSSNGIDENIAILLAKNSDKLKQEDKKNYYKYGPQHAYSVRNHEKLLEYFHKYYQVNKKVILQKKKKYNNQPEVKQHNCDYHTGSIIWTIMKN